MENIRTKILLVEDDRTSQQLTLTLLKQLNCDIDIARKGWEALEKINTDTYNLIFMDIGLPDIDGFMVIEAIRKNEGEKTRTPIIALTIHDDEKHKMRCIEAGANEVITKPLTIDIAQKMLNQFVFDK